MKKLISILTPCFNEEDNVEELYMRVKKVFDDLPNYSYEHIFIDNASTDKTVAKLKQIAANNANIKIIVNIKNFGQVRSPLHGLMQTNGEAVIGLVADLQDPPELIPKFLEKWGEGYKAVMGVKSKSEESRLMFTLRTFYYRILKLISEEEQIINATGFGLYDREIVDMVRSLNESAPYFRGLVVELGYPRALIEYDQPARKRGFTKNNFFTLYELAMLGITSYSKIPLRLATFLGFGSALVSFLVGMFYLIYKLLFWTSFSLGLAPIAVGIFFFGSVQLFFLGILGEYIGAINTKVTKRPLVIEKERINF
jgi:glycosyltransferase involved in cell wall biosynthesis